MTASGYSVGIDLGATFIKLAAVSAAGEILAQRREPTMPMHGAQRIFEDLRPVIEEMAASAGLPYPPPNGCGIGLPGIVDHRRGWLRLCGSLGWRDVPVAALAREAFGCEVAVDIDVQAGALADLYFGRAREASNLIYISWGTGIGCGLVIERRLYHSRGGSMCNLGHMLAEPESGRPCYCGCRGCLEAEAGGRAMVEQVLERLRRGEESTLEPEGLTPERIALAAAEGDALARGVLDRSARLLARVLASVLSLMNPDTVIFGGGVSRCWPIIQETFERELLARSPDFAVNSAAVLQSQFGATAGMLGAALLPIERSLV